MDEIAAAGQNGASSASSLSSVTMSDNFDTFLKLLTTQLKNQDPLEPMDTKEFVQELTQFTAVEQAIQTNSNLEQLLTLSRASQTSSAVNYLGKGVEAEGDVNMLKDGQATWTYELTAGSETTSLMIEDQFGTVVYVQPGETSTGPHKFNWDGKDNDGNQQADGIYRLVVGAADVQGTPIDSTTYIGGIVTSVRSDPSGAIVFIDDVGIPLENVIRINEPTTLSTNSGDEAETTEEQPDQGTTENQT